MKSLKHTAIAFLFLLSAGFLQAQKSIQDSVISFGHISLSYGAMFPGGDFADRFGYTNQVGGEAGIKFSNNFYLWAGGYFIFGSNVKEPIARNVTFPVVNNSGETEHLAIGADGRLYGVLFFERGFSAPLVFGKIFPVFKKTNPNCGIFVEAGLQFLQHQVRIESIGSNIPFLDKVHKKGYDRLTNGIGFTQGVGYKHYSNSRLLNFQIGFHVSEIFTQSRRSFNYDLGYKDETQRLDILFGIKAGWSFLIYRAAPEKTYFY